MTPADTDAEGEILAALAGDAASPAAGRTRLLEALEGPCRYLPFSRLLSRHFDLPLPEVDRLLARASDEDSFIAGVEPIRRYLDFRPGPRAVAPRAGLVWLAAGGRIPGHRHVEPESMVVLEGLVTDDAGRRAGAGDVLALPAGSSHTVHIDDASDALIALLHGKIHLLGT